VTLKVRIRRVDRPEPFVEADTLVDSGAIWAVVPARVVRRLGIRPHGREEFRLADGTVVRRPVGSAFFEIDGRKGAAPVIFGRPGDACLLGALALEAMGLMLDPLRRRLRPLPMVLARPGRAVA
jgi:clan AA aspartic protease